MKDQKKEKIQKLLQTTNEKNFPILHCIKRSITNKHDFVDYLDPLDQKFSLIGLTETSLNSSNVNDFLLHQYSLVERVRNCKIGGGVGLGLL